MKNMKIYESKRKVCTTCNARRARYLILGVTRYIYGVAMIIKIRRKLYLNLHYIHFIYILYVSYIP